MNTPRTLTIPERKALRVTLACLILLGGAGLFLGYANPFYQLPPLALFYPACLAVFSRLMPTAKGSFYAGWICAALGNSACLYWVSVPMHDFALVPWPLTLPAIIALGGYLGLYGGLFSLVYRLFRARLPFFAALVLVLPLWTALDIAKEYLFSGFPWVSLATAFIPWPEWTFAASFIGSAALSGAFALIAVAIAEARPVRLSPAFGGFLTPKKRQRLCLGMAILTAGLVYVCSFTSSLPEGRAVTVGLVQGNIDQNQKWEPAYQAGTVDRYLTLSEWTVNPAMGRVARPVDLVIWPETSMPFYLETNAGLADKVFSFSARYSVPLVFGAPGKSERPDGSGYYNRMWLQTPNPFERQHYDKTHLVPFGEYVPLNLPLPFIEYFLQGLDFIPGATREPLTTGDLALGGLICYEAIFPGLARQRVADGANLLINISNDAWFGKTSAPVQHLHLTAMRAIEQGRYVARATNTGLNAVITPRGRIASKSTLFRAEAMVGTVRLIQGFTPYHRLAPYILWANLLAATAAVAYCLLAAKRGRGQ